MRRHMNLKQSICCRKLAGICTSCVVLTAGLALLSGQAVAGEAGTEAVSAEEAITESIGPEAVIAEETATEKAEEGKKKASQTKAPEEESTRAQKEETVYVIADASGNQERVIVSDWLKNAGGEDAITDETILSDIENLKGDETWSTNEDGTISWDAGGNDIFYEGTTDEQLPVTVHVTYMLDGEEMAPEEIAGKSGEVTIRYEYENHTGREIELDGAKSTFHVPFAVVTGILLDESSMHDVRVTNGRVISDGDHNIAVGIAFPGIAEDLDTPAYAALTKLAKADVPEYIEITGQTENFTWGTVYTVVTSELFSAADSDLLSGIDDVFGKLDSLKSGVGQIADGVSSLSEGTGDLKAGADELAAGLTDLDDSSEALVEGAGQIVQGVLETVQEQLAQAGISVEELTLDNYSSVLGTLQKMSSGEAKEKLEAVIEKLDGVRTFYEGLSDYTDGVSQAKEGADQVSAGVASLQGGEAKLLLGTAVLRAALPDLAGVKEALQETAALGEEYKSFSGLAEGMSGKVRFIWKIAEILQ